MLGPVAKSSELRGTAPAGFSRVSRSSGGHQISSFKKAFYYMLLLNLLPAVRGWNDTAPTFMLPTVQMQFICHKDIRDEFLVERFFSSFYEQAIHIPTFYSGGNTTDDNGGSEIDNAILRLNETRFRRNVLKSSMQDIPPTKWYYNSCNTSSSQVLYTMQVEGWAQLHLQPDGTNTDVDLPMDDLSFTEDDFMEAMMDAVTPTTLEDFLGGNACNSIGIFRAYVDYVPEIHQHNRDHSPAIPPGGNDKSLGYFDEHHLEHSLILLCATDDYDFDEPDSGFVIFGLMVGMVMAAMLMAELQQYNELPRRREAAAAAAEARANAAAESATETSEDSNARRQRRRRSRRTSRRSSRQQGRRGDYAITSQIELEMV